jgi:hypothetical protein
MARGGGGGQGAARGSGLARAGLNGRDGPGRGEAAAQGGPRARWAAGWGAGFFFYFFLISLYFVLFCFLHHFKSNSLLNARSTKSPNQENKSMKEDGT